MSRKPYKNLFDYLSRYNEEEIKWAVTQLSERDQKIIYTRDGENLSDPHPENLESKDKSYYYTSIVPKLKSILAAERVRLKNPTKIAPTIEKTDTPIKLKNNAIAMLKGPKEELKNNKQQKNTALPIQHKKKYIDVINNYDKINILTYIKTEEFKDLLQVLTNEQAIVICLKNGYVQGKYYSNDAIAEILNVEPEKVIEIEKEALLVYRLELDDENEIETYKVKEKI